MITDNMVYAIIDYSARDFIPLVGDMVCARTAFLNLIMREYVISNLKAIFANGDIVKLAAADLERLYDFYLKYLWAVREENGYSLIKNDDGKVAAMIGPNGLEVPGEAEVCFTVEEHENPEEETSGHLYLPAFLSNQPQNDNRLVLMN